MKILEVGAVLLFWYYVVVSLSYIVLFAISYFARSDHMFRLSSLRFSSLRNSPFLVPVSIIVPARNEEMTIVESVRALLDLDYPELEIIVVNDGSTDRTLTTLSDTFDLRSARVLYVDEVKCGNVKGFYLSRSERRLAVIDKESRRSKADAVNAGLNAATGAFVCIVDADSILEKDALLRIMSAVHTDTRKVVAVGGIVRVLNGCATQDGRLKKVLLPKRTIELFQTLEYLRAFLIGREGWAKLDMLPIISGAFGLFNTRILRQIGGLTADSDAEDLDLVIRVHKTMLESGEDYTIAFVPDPTCWTEVPADIRSLGSQRSRWHRGLLQVLWQHRHMLFRPRYGRIGFILLPYMWLFEAFEPLAEAIGYGCTLLALILGSADRMFLLEVLLVGYAFSILVSIGAIILEEMTHRRYQSVREVSTLVAYSFVEFFFYHELNLWWRLKGTFQFVAGTGEWTPIKRTRLVKRTSQPVT